MAVYTFMMAVYFKLSVYSISNLDVFVHFISIFGNYGRLSASCAMMGYMFAGHIDFSEF